MTRPLRRYLGCASHVRSADLHTAVLLLDLRTGQVDALLGKSRHIWLNLAQTGTTAGASSGPERGHADPIVDDLVTTGILQRTNRPRPWPVPAIPRTAPSWGTTDISAAIPANLRMRGLGTLALAWFALGLVLAVRAAGTRRRSFARILRLITAATWRRGAAPAEARHVDEALESVRVVASVLPFRIACLEETAAAMLVLALTGRRAGWCHGVAADPIRLHAWIALNGQPIGEPASTNHYTPLIRIPAPTTSVR